MTFSTLRFRAICHATEDEARVRQALEFVSGGAPISVGATKGHHGNRIAVLESELSKKKDIEAFWRRAEGAGLVEALLARLDSALGDDLWLGMRLDKQEALAGRLAFDEGGDVVHTRARAAAYPATLENARRAVVDYFELICKVA